MKKLLIRLLTISLVAFTLAGCNSGSTSTSGSGDGTGSACPIRVGFVTDVGGVDDKSFNQSAWEGINRYAEEQGWDADACLKVIQSSSDADYIPNLTSMAEDGFDLVIAVGYLFEASLNEVAPLFPDTKFFVVDTVVSQPNVVSATFAAEQGSFLVGVAAGLRAKAEGWDKVGFLGGVEGELIGAFQAGYEQGVWAVYPEAEIVVDYADAFNMPEVGKNIAVKQFDSGVHIIYQAAGSSGNGAISEAKERGSDYYVIGVDKDQYHDGDMADGSSVILTSMVKRVDVATYTVTKDVHQGTYAGGSVMVFNINNEGVGAETSTGRNLSDIEIETILEYNNKVVAGEIEVSPTPVIPNGQSGTYSSTH
ncbi:MAG: BMP family ABC transporter substrate-binding protein [Erysipelotrichaceae bacterium]|jgi:basic membrane protein A|nr:BMP family ABC transporter substrate-binding protein [Erysipelotrichaceae bacterium]